LKLRQHSNRTKKGKLVQETTFQGLQLVRLVHLVHLALLPLKELLWLVQKWLRIRWTRPLQQVLVGCTEEARLKWLPWMLVLKLPQASQWEPIQTWWMEWPTWLLVELLFKEAPHAQLTVPPMSIRNRTPLHEPQSKLPQRLPPTIECKYLGFNIAFG
jgi:hypothetical protein